MVVGILRIRLYMRQNRSLKEKRMVVQRVRDRITHRFSVSVAEVGDLDEWKTAILGVSLVSNDGAVAASALDKICDSIENLSVAEVLDHDRVIHHYKDGQPLQM